MLRSAARHNSSGGRCRTGAAVATRGCMPEGRARVYCSSRTIWKYSARPASKRSSSREE
jgi:hypothetical protein